MLPVDLILTLNNRLIIESLVGYNQHMKYQKVILLFLFSLLFAAAQFLGSKTEASDTGSVALTSNVQYSISLDIPSSTYGFGNITSGVPERGTAGITADVTTNAENGYNLMINDGISGSNSALLHSDGLVRIADFSSTIDAPDLWDDGNSKGLGFTVFSADTGKEAKWGSGTAFDDVANKYAGVPEDETTIHQTDVYKEGEDSTGVAFILDVDPDQKAGTYSGNITLTATANL